MSCVIVPVLGLALALGGPPAPGPGPDPQGAPPPLWPGAEGAETIQLEPERPQTPEFLAWESRQRQLFRRMVGFGATMGVGMTVGLAGAPMFALGVDPCSDGKCGLQYTGLTFMIAGGTATVVGLVGLIVYATRVKRHAREDPRLGLAPGPGGFALRF